MIRIIKYILYDLIRTRFILFYTLFLFVSTMALFQLDSDPVKVIMSLLNIALMVVPLVSIVFVTIHLYNSSEFIELMLAQPVARRTVFLAEYVSVGSSLTLSCIVGVGIPILIYTAGISGWYLVGCTIGLTLVFTSLAFLGTVLTRDKAKAIGIALLFWFYFSLIYDAFVLYIVYTFSDYPLEKITISLIAFNPIDLTRIIMLMQLDISALMGYTGAFYKDFFGSHTGLIFSTSILTAWILVPLILATRVFSKKDL